MSRPGWEAALRSLLLPLRLGVVGDCLLQGVRVSQSPGSSESLRVCVGVGSDASRVLVQLRGDIDLATAPGLERRLADLVGDGATFVIVDLSDVAFCDVPGLNALLRVEALVRFHRGRLHLLGPCRSVDMMVSLLGLTDRLLVEQPDDRGDAGDGTGCAEKQICQAASTIWA